MSVLSITEVVGGCLYLQFHLSALNGTFFAFKMLNTETRRQMLEKVLRDETVVFWYHKTPFKLKHTNKSRQFYYSRGNFFYYKHSILYVAPLEEDHIDTITDFLIATDELIS